MKICLMKDAFMQWKLLDLTNIFLAFPWPVMKIILKNNVIAALHLISVFTDLSETGTFLYLF